MSSKNSKLIQYLQSNNHEMAITAYNEKPEQLPDQLMLQLSRAYFINQEYQKSLKISAKYIKDARPQFIFDSMLLYIKAKYLLGQKVQTDLKELQKIMKSNPNLSQGWPFQIFNEIRQAVQFQYNNRALTMNKAELVNFGKQFATLLNQEQRQNPLVDCMPMFIVSERWFSLWECFVGLRRSENPIHPGPITHFQVLDHRFNMLYDPTPQKKYTNQIIYQGAKVRAIPKKCWMMLQKNFRGFELKRFNIWVMGKPRQIMTEIFLKRISIRKIESNFVYQVQITKKQTWGGLAKKLRTIWNQKDSKIILQQHQNIYKPVNDKVFLQEVDTIGRIYVFGEVPQHVKSSTTTLATPLYKCNHCSSTKDLKYCQCKSVKYCDSKCQKQDRDRHRKKCQIQFNHLKQKAAVLESFHLPEKSFTGRKGLVGLRNLGNTCYMNSGLQCLSNTREITEYFMKNQFIKEINHTNPLGTKGNLSCAYAQLIRQIWTGSQSSISPFTLKKIIGKFAAQFSGYGQQDSQQFISYLIDGLQQDLNLVKNKQTFQTNDEIAIDEEGSRKSQENYAKRIQSYIRNLMVGQFKSTVICSKCNKTSVTFDPYLLVSLPIPALRQKQVFFVSMDCQRKTKRIYFLMDNFSTLAHLREQLNIYYDVGPKYGSFLVFSIVDLTTFEVKAQNIADNVSMTEISNQLTQTIVLLAYQFVDMSKNESRYQVEYLYKNQKLSFPRFVNLPKNPTGEQILDKIQGSITRYLKREQESSLKSLVEAPEVTEKKITIKLKLKIETLTCQSQKKLLKLQQEKKLTLNECFINYTNPQILQDHNRWYCNRCKQHQRATKQMEIYKTNKILVLAFKRFNRGSKVKDFVQFPLEGLNLGPYIKSNKQKNPILYDLYGVVNHYGSLGGGHYTAYCKNFLLNEWFQFDDSRVSKINAQEAVSQSAYVLFYRRRM